MTTSQEDPPLYAATVVATGVDPAKVTAEADAITDAIREAEQELWPEPDR